MTTTICKRDAAFRLFSNVFLRWPEEVKGGDTEAILLTCVSESIADLISLAQRNSLSLRRFPRFANLIKTIRQAIWTSVIFLEILHAAAPMLFVNICPRN